MCYICIKQYDFIVTIKSFYKPIFSSPFAMDFPRFLGQLTPLDNASDIFSHPEPRQAANGETVTKRPAQMKPIGQPMNIKTTFFRL